MTEGSVHNILVLGFTSDRNRGDAALQVGLLNLLHRHFPNSTISIITRFGANQAADLPVELDHTARLPVTLLGGLTPTFYPLGSSKNKPEYAFEILNLFFLPLALALLGILWIGIPADWMGQILPADFQKSLYAIRNADLVILKGRNIRSRSNPLIELYRFIYMFYHSMLCNRLGKRIFCIGASVWPISNSVSRWLVRNALKQCEFISVREQNSYDALKDLLGDEYLANIHLLPDLSFAACDQADALQETRHPLSEMELPQQVGITLMDWAGSGSQARGTYILSIVEAVRFLVKRGSQITIIPQVTSKWEDFTGIWRDIHICLSSKELAQVQVLDRDLNVNELLETYAQLDFLIATRMHSAIFASMVGTPIVAIAYDSGGKWGVLYMLGYRDFVIPYGQITPDKLLERFTTCWSMRAELIKEVQHNVQINRQQVDQHVSLWASKFSDRSGF